MLGVSPPLRLMGSVELVYFIYGNNIYGSTFAHAKRSAICTTHIGLLQDINEGAFSLCELPDKEDGKKETIQSKTQEPPQGFQQQPYGDCV